MHDARTRRMSFAAKQGDGAAWNRSDSAGIAHLRLTAVAKTCAVHCELWQPFGAGTDQGAQHTNLHVVDVKAATAVVGDTVQAQPQRSRADDRIGNVQELGNEVCQWLVLHILVPERAQKVAQGQFAGMCRYAEAMTTGGTMAK